jgi:hypothetical protein
MMSVRRRALSYRVGGRHGPIVRFPRQGRPGHGRQSRPRPGDGARVFHARADIVIASRKLEGCREAANEITATRRRALAVACHVGEWDQLDALVEQAYAAFGKVDVLINNAGMSPVAPSSLETRRR